MKLLRSLALLAALSLAALASAAEFRTQPAQRGPTRVACVGDSITYGANIPEREKNAYPASLWRMLGPLYDVKNFGANAATLLKKGDKPYWDLQEFKDADAYAPDIVVIKLGTNDSKPHNWAHKDEFAADARALVQHFRALPSKPLVYVCLPVPVYQDRWGINEKTVAGEIIPALRQVAKELGAPVIDLHAAMRERGEYFPDGVHPNQAGAAFMAQAVRYEIAPH
ncbi:MAG: hypothetical protein HY301_03325 [Verrucomicrobia bacterium]|nr:hypothetical protein [Verrucomicrobiota bacterium]